MKIKENILQDKPVIFIVVDSVRSFKTGLDDRDKLVVMDRFSKDAIEFTNAFCSAPSSIMSASSMFTGLTSAYVSRNYQDWQFTSIISLQSILKKRGYQIYSIDNSKESREMMQTLTMPIKKKYYPKGISHADFWKNKDLCRILRNIFEKHKPNKKSFFMLWFDCREDPTTSDCVEETLNIFKEYDFYDDGIFFITSDHGYPSPKTGLTYANMKGIGHDMVITDDNVKIPLYLKYKDCVPQKINSLVSNVDLSPTVLDILKIDKRELSKKAEGISLLNKIQNIEDDSRIIRIDTRLFSQDNRITALRSKTHKFVHYIDQNKFELYDLVNDKDELKPIKIEGNQIEIFNKFKNKYLEWQKVINNYHYDEIFLNLKKVENAIINSKKIILLNKLPKELLKIIINQIIQLNSEIKIYLIQNIEDLDVSKKNVLKLNEWKIDQEKFDIGMIIQEKTTFSFTPADLIRKAKKSCNKILFFDFNMKKLNPFISKWLWPLWKYSLNIEFYKDEPKIIFIDLVKIFKTVLNRYLFKKVTKLDIYQQKQLRDRALSNKKSEKI